MHVRRKADEASLLHELDVQFWAWRVRTAPDSSDDITRLERPPHWVPDWSAGAVEARRDALRGFCACYRALDLSRESVGIQVNGRLLGSALARAHWELDLVQGWRTNPIFYLDQTLGAVFPLLLSPPPFERTRAEAIIERLGAIPAILGEGRDNLAGHAAAAFANAALELLTHAPSDVRVAMAALRPLLPRPHRADVADIAEAAAVALETYQDWLHAELPGFTGRTEIGPEAFAFYLHRVALLPYTTAEVIAMGRQEWDRAVFAEAIRAHRYGHLPAPPLPADSAIQVDRQANDETEVRDFYAGKGILSQPDSLRHYRFASIPAYIAPLSWLGVTDDLTSPAHANADAVRYVPQPSPDLSYFDRAAAEDPRLAIVHEGVHSQQLALSWRHQDPVRRHYYDSTPNEGIAFYNEELMLLSGLFDDNPNSVGSITNLLRLRALRVEIDVALALGDLTIQTAARRLGEAVPLDPRTAMEEAVFFAGNPGQAASYLIGKRQILALLAEAARRDRFALDTFHDRLWREGNVPLVLQRWELLGLRDDLDRTDNLAEATSW